MMWIFARQMCTKMHNNHFLKNMHYTLFEEECAKQREKIWWSRAKKWCGTKMVPVFFGHHFFRLPIPPPPAGFPVHRRGVGVVFPVHRRGVVHATPRHRGPPFLPNRFSSTGLIPRRKWQLLKPDVLFMARRHAKEAAFDRASTPHVVKRCAGR